MSLNNVMKNFEDEFISIAKDLYAKLKFETRDYNTSAKSDIMLSCSLIPVDPFLDTFRGIRSQYILQVDYICDVKGKTDIDNGNIKAISNQFNIDKIIHEDAIIYRPTSVTQWINKDSKRVAIISIYFQIDEVI